VRRGHPALAVGMTVRGRSIPLPALTWFGLLGAPVAWVGQFLVGFGASLAACGAAGRHWGVPVDGWTLAATIVAATIAVLGAAAAQPPQGIVRPTDEGGLSQLAVGAQLYAGNCASCHGAGGRGVASPRPQRGAGDIVGQGPPLAGVGAQAADFYLRTGYMPLSDPHEQPKRSRVLFSAGERRALTAFVASLGTGPPIPSPDPAAGSVAEGQQLFISHCAGCHQAVAQGGVVTG